MLVIHLILHGLFCLLAHLLSHPQTYGSPPGKVGNLERIAQREKLSPAELVHVGDGDNDCKAAAAFGCAFVGIQIKMSKPDPTKHFSASAHALVPDQHAARGPLCHLLGVVPAPPDSCLLTVRARSRSVDDRRRRATK